MRPRPHIGSSVIATVFLAALVAGCGISLRHSEPVTETTIPVLNPFEYGDEFAATRSDNAGEAALPLSSAQPSPPVASQSDTYRAVPDQFRPDRPAGFNYTVQIGFYPDEKSARNLEALARQRTEAKISIVFDEPFYRVRVGEFISLQEAEREVDMLMEMGFRDARWIQVKTNGQ